MYKYVIFDLDGTIIDTSLGTVQCFKAALNELGIEMSDEKIRSYIGPPFTRTLVNEFSIPEIEARAAMDIGHRYLAEEGYKSCVLFDGIRELLDTLKKEGVPMSVATSQPERTAVIESEFVGITEYFRSFEANNEYQTRGTKSDFVRMCLDDFAPDDIKEVVMIGDKPADIRGGKDNGLDTIGVLYGYGTKEEIDSAEPDYQAEKPEDIIEIVLGLR